MLSSCYVVLQRLLGAGKTMEGNTDPRTTQTNGNGVCGHPGMRSAHSALWAEFDLLREIRGGFREQVEIELSSAGCVGVCKAKGGCKNILVTVLAPQGPAAIAYISFVVTF